MRKIAFIALATLLTASAFAAGEVYRWKDSNGGWHYSDQPQPGAELVKTVRRPTNDPITTPPAPATATASTAPAASSPVSREVAQQVRQDAAAAKATQCRKAEDDYQKTVQARRLYKTDDKGNRTFLSDAEIDAARLEARSNRDLACG